MCMFFLPSYEDCSLSFCIFMSSSSDVGTLTKAGTVTAFNLRKACTGSSVISARACVRGAKSDRRPHQERPRPAGVGKGPPAPNASGTDEGA